jgi:hypothetical protein
LLTLRAASLTSPALVNLHALLRRLSSICRSRIESTFNAPRFSGTSTTRRFLFCSASCPAVLITSLISSASCTVCGLSSKPLGLRPWHPSPCHVDLNCPEDIATPSGQLLLRTRELGISDYHPDPLTAVAMAERRAAEAEDVLTAAANIAPLRRHPA